MIEIYLFVLGLIFGSFANVVIFRTPRGLSVVSGRSQCPACGRPIKWHDNIPFISFFLLKGRCRECWAKISWQYPLVELASGLIFLFSFWALASQGLAYWLVSVFLLEMFLILFVTDLNHLILPNSVILSGLAGVFIYGLAEKTRLAPIGLNIFSLDSLLGALILSSLLFSIWLVSAGRGLGLGDVKLAGLVGLVFGLTGGIIVLYLGIVAGALVGVSMLLLTRANLKTKLPLGSFISLAAGFYILGGSAIIERLDFINFIFRIFK